MNNIKDKRIERIAGFMNKSNLDFADISDEEYREYVFVVGDKEVIVKIDKPLRLNVSKTHSHRIYAADGMSHYIPAGWIHLRWKAKEGSANFVL